MPKHHAGILFHRNATPRRPRPSLRALQKFLDIESHQRRGHHAEVRKRRIASADAGQPEEDVAEVVALGDLLHLRAGIGDGDEAAAGFVRADSLLHALKEILLEDVGLERAARFAGNDEQRLRQIDLALRML